MSRTYNAIRPAMPYSLDRMVSTYCYQIYDYTYAHRELGGVDRPQRIHGQSAQEEITRIMTRRMVG